jgi:hypothetical protein
MADKLQGKRVAFVVAPEGAEQVELTEGTHEGQRRSVSAAS